MCCEPWRRHHGGYQTESRYLPGYETARGLRSVYLHCETVTWCSRINSCHLMPCHLNVGVACLAKSELITMDQPKTLYELQDISASQPQPRPEHVYVIDICVFVCSLTALTIRHLKGRMRTKYEQSLMRFGFLYGQKGHGFEFSHH